MLTWVDGHEPLPMLRAVLQSAQAVQARTRVRHGSVCVPRPAPVPVARARAATRACDVPLSLTRTTHSVISPRRQLLVAMAQLHPTTLTPALREAWGATHAEAVALLLPMLRAVRGELCEEGARLELLRLCLALQFNGFSAGLFLHQAIFNHGRAADANCDKACHALRATHCYSTHCLPRNA